MPAKQKTSPVNNLLRRGALGAGAGAKRSGKGGASGGGMGGQQAGGVKGGGKRKTHVGAR